VTRELRNQQFMKIISLARKCYEKDPQGRSGGGAVRP